MEFKRLKIMRLNIGSVNLVTREKQVMEQLISRAKKYPKMSFNLGWIVHKERESRMTLEITMLAG